MAYLKEQYDLLATNQTFSKRVKMGYFTVAREVLAEASPEKLHQQGFARRVIMDQDIQSPGYVAAIATDPNVVAAAVAKYTSGDATQKQQVDWAQSGVTDDAILDAIRTAWPYLSEGQVGI